MLSAHAGLITTINANGRIILVMAANLSVPGINNTKIPGTKSQTNHKAPNSKPQTAWNL
jgi:hypothetical protein